MHFTNVFTCLSAILHTQHRESTTDECCHTSIWGSVLRKAVAARVVVRDEVVKACPLLVRVGCSKVGDNPHHLLAAGHV